jgi:hypothetical protein
MSESKSRALVPFGKKLPAKSKKADAKKAADPARANHAGNNALNLVDSETFMVNREQVKRLLPDILGKVLARIWIDKAFLDEFSQNPEQTLANNGVHLPEVMSIEFQKSQSDRPRIVVYEQQPGSKFKMRVLYLQLIMMAGR